MEYEYQLQPLESARHRPSSRSSMLTKWAEGLWAILLWVIKTSPFHKVQASQHILLWVGLQRLTQKPQHPTRNSYHIRYTTWCPTNTGKTGLPSAEKRSAWCNWTRTLERDALSSKTSSRAMPTSLGQRCKRVGYRKCLTPKSEKWPLLKTCSGG